MSKLYPLKIDIFSHIMPPKYKDALFKHLGLWEVKARPPPKTHPSPKGVHIDYVYLKKVPLEEEGVTLHYSLFKIEEPGGYLGGERIRR